MENVSRITIKGVTIATDDATFKKLSRKVYNLKKKKYQTKLERIMAEAKKINIVDDFPGCDKHIYLNE